MWTVYTLQKFQHIVTKLTMYYVKSSGDPEGDDYRHKQFKYRDKLVVTLWAAVKVAEINGKTKQHAAPRETRTRDIKGQNAEGKKRFRRWQMQGQHRQERQNMLAVQARQVHVWQGLQIQARARGLGKQRGIGEATVGGGIGELYKGNPTHGMSSG